MDCARRHQTRHFRKQHTTSAPAEGPAHGLDFARPCEFPLRAPQASVRECPDCMVRVITIIVIVTIIISSSSSICICICIIIIIVNRRTSRKLRIGISEAFYSGILRILRGGTPRSTRHFPYVHLESTSLSLRILRFLVEGFLI